jgi:hypothetical protein
MAELPGEEELGMSFIGVAAAPLHGHGGAGRLLDTTDAAADRPAPRRKRNLPADRTIPAWPPF